MSDKNGDAMREKPAYSISELLEIHPGGRTALYEEIKSGRLAARKMGDRTIILHSDYITFLEALPTVQAQSARGAAALELGVPD